MQNVLRELHTAADSRGSSYHGNKQTKWKRKQEAPSKTKFIYRAHLQKKKKKLKNFVWAEETKRCVTDSNELPGRCKNVNKATVWGEQSASDFTQKLRK